MEKPEIYEQQAKKYAKKLHYALVDLSESYESDKENGLGEPEFTQFLIDNVIPHLTEFKEVYGTTSLNHLDLAWELSDPEREYNITSIERAAYRMKWDALMQIESISYHMKNTIALCEKHALKSDDIEYLKKDAEELREALLSALWDRAQVHESRIEKLKNAY